MIQDGVPEQRSFEMNCGSDVQGRTIFVIVRAQCVGHMCCVVRVPHRGIQGSNSDYSAYAISALTHWVILPAPPFVKSSRLH